MDILNFTDYEKHPDDMNATFKSFTKSLFEESQKVDQSRNGAIFISKSDSKSLSAYVLVNRTSAANVQMMSALAIEAVT